MHRSELIQALFENMDITKRLVYGRLQLVMSGSNLTRTQLELLSTINQLQPITAKELGQKLQLTPGAISQLADELDKQQLIERQHDPADRRRQALRISAQGLSLLTTIEKKRRVVMEQVMTSLTDQELATWLKIQQKLISAFQISNKDPNERSSH